MDREAGRWLAPHRTDASAAPCVDLQVHLIAARTGKPERAPA
jgi:hypothetical protein